MRRKEPDEFQSYQKVKALLEAEGYQRHDGFSGYPKLEMPCLCPWCKGEPIPYQVWIQGRRYVMLRVHMSGDVEVFRYVGGLCGEETPGAKMFAKNREEDFNRIAAGIR